MSVVGETNFDPDLSSPIISAESVCYDYHLCAETHNIADIMISILLIMVIISPPNIWMTFLIMEPIPNSWLDWYALMPWLRHQMETFSTILALCAGIHRSPVNSPHKGQWRGTLILSLICDWINGLINNRKAGDLRRHQADYDVIVIQPLKTDNRPSKYQQFT